MEAIEPIITALFSVNSIWSVVGRTLLWVIIAAIIIISSDTPDPEKSFKSLKANLGFLLLFLFLSGGLVFLLFGYMPGL